MGVVTVPTVTFAQRRKKTNDTEHAPTKRVDNCNTNAQRMDRLKRACGHNKNSKQKALDPDP